MKKILICLIMLFPMTLLAESIPESINMYVVTLNTTTFTSVGITGSKGTMVYNPGAYDIKLASATSSVAGARFTVKAASYLPANINLNGNFYALATDTNSVSLQLLAVK